MKALCTHGARAAPGAVRGALPAGGVGQAGSGRGVTRVTSCPRGETSDAFLCCDATKSFVAFGNFVKESIALWFFSILNSGEGKRHAVACLWGQLCWRAPIHAIPDLFQMKEKQIRDPESHRSVAPSSCPSSEGGSPQHPLASVGAALKRAWVGTSSRASGQADGFFQGLYDIPEASTCPSISRAQGQPMEDRINWFSSK